MGEQVLKWQGHISLWAIGWLIVSVSPTSATWSIVGVDTAAQEVGIAAASCHKGAHTIAAVVPGVGVVSAQGLTSVPAREHAMALLKEGKSAGEIVKAITSPGIDKDWFFRRWLRQYGVASLAEPQPFAQAYTGPFVLPRRGTRYAPGVSVQGNMLRADVLDHTLSAFVSTARECGLAYSLLAALEAGAAAGGDRRCSPEQTALSAFLIVARPDDSADQPSIHLAAPDQDEGGENPVEMLVDLFKESAGSSCTMTADQN